MLNPTFVEVKVKLATNRRWCEWAILAIYKNQTEEEKRKHDVKEMNGIGFNRLDVNLLSSFAEQLLRGHPLSEKQLNLAFNRMPKYAGQLCRKAGIPISIKRTKECSTSN